MAIPHKNTMVDKIDISHSQNFFRDELYVERLVTQTDICKQDDVIEIGPGRGIITKVLSKVARSVTGI